MVDDALGLSDDKVHAFEAVEETLRLNPVQSSILVVNDALFPAFLIRPENIIAVNFEIQLVEGLLHLIILNIDALRK